MLSGTKVDALPFLDRKHIIASPVKQSFGPGGINELDISWGYEFRSENKLNPNMTDLIVFLTVGLKTRSTEGLNLRF